MAKTTKGRKNTDEAVLIRRSAVAEMYARGEWQYVIATNLGVSPAQITEDLKHLKKEWASRLSAHDDLLSSELMRIDQLEREYYQAWVLSKEGKKQTSVTQTTIKNKPLSDRNTSSIRNENDFGDPRYLAGVQWCIQRRCDLLGLNAPKKITPVDENGDVLTQTVQVTVYIPSNNRE